MTNVLKDLADSEKYNLYNNSIDIKDIELNYVFLKKNENEKIYLKILESMEKKKLTHYKIFKEVNEFEILISEIFNDSNILNKYLCLFIMDSFNETLIEKNINKKQTDIHDNINKIKKNLENLNIFIRRKKKLEEKEVSKMQEFILKILKFLELENVIKSTNYNLSNKTYTALSLPGFKLIPKFEIYKEPFSVFQFSNKRYIFSKTFNSIKKLNSLNVETNDFEVNDIQFIENILNERINIDIDLLKIIFNEFCLENNVKAFNAEEYYEKLLLAHTGLVLEKDLLAYKESSKQISLYQKLLFFKFILDNNISYCYTSILLDFRGRVYKTSDFSITFIKELRFCIHFGYYDENFIKEYKEVYADKIINNYIYLLKGLGQDLFIKIQNKNNIFKRALIWTFISIAENFKTELGKSITIIEFIKKGINIYLNKDLNFKYEKKIKLIAYFKIIDMLINEEKIIKRLISKDATASVYQHLVKLLQGINEESYKITNLKSEDTWYDTYEYIIEKWKNEKKEIIKNIDLDDINKYFNRNTLKKIMMTQNYGCGFKKCYDYYFEKLDNIDWQKKKKIGKLLYNFYNYLLENNGITLNNTNSIITFLDNHNYDKIILSDGSRVDMRYFVLKIYRIDTKIKNKRYTYTIVERTDVINLEQTKKACKANYVHMHDAALAREVAKKIKCFIIHDCFMIGCLEVSILIDVVNECMGYNYHNKWFFKNTQKIYSIFIVV